jgi:hypothetical protein
MTHEEQSTAFDTMIQLLADEGFEGMAEAVGSSAAWQLAVFYVGRCERQELAKCRLSRRATAPTVDNFFAHWSKAPYAKDRYPVFRKPLSIGMPLVCSCRIRKFIAVRIDFN